MMRSFRYFVALGMFSALLGACGLKGPLYLPDEKREEAVTPGEAGQPAPQSQKKDREKTPGAAEAPAQSP